VADINAVADRVPAPQIEYPALIDGQWAAASGAKGRAMRSTK